MDEILALGVLSMELGYNTSLDLVPGIREAVAQDRIKISSLHNYCPIPMGAPYGHPELFLFASPDRDARRRAVRHTAETLRFAAELGAGIVVTHSGYVATRVRSRDLIELMEQGKAFTPKYEKKLHKLRLQREKRASKRMGFLMGCLEELIPVMKETGVVLALENLPSWEAYPTEAEGLSLATTYAPYVRCWHDTGHAQIRKNMGFINPIRWLERQKDVLAGMHVHDVAAPARDHVMPPHGIIDFAPYREFATMGFPLVLEPSPDTPSKYIREAIEFLQTCWSDTEESAQEEYYTDEH